MENKAETYMTQFGGRPYQEWMEVARRWDKSVNFGSVMNTWTDEMLAERRAVINTPTTVTDPVTTTATKENDNDHQ